MSFRLAVSTCLVAAMATPAFARDAAPPAPAAGGCTPAVSDIDSPAGQAWLSQNGWRYATPAAAQVAFDRLVKTMSPWPDWAQPQLMVLTAGTRLQMAMAPGQQDNQAGGFLTFDGIASVAEVRRLLAVRGDWKPQVNRVVTFEITRDVAAAVGPIGPQLDPTSCQLLPGGWTQVELLVAPADRMNYLNPVGSRDIE